MGMSKNGVDNNGNPVWYDDEKYGVVNGKLLLLGDEKSLAEEKSEPVKEVKADKPKRKPKKKKSGHKALFN